MGRKHGSVFVLTIWAMFWLSIFAISLGFTARSRIDLVRRLDVRDVVVGISDSGIYSVVQYLIAENKKNPDLLYFRVVKKLRDSVLAPEGHELHEALKKIRYNYRLSISDGTAYCALSDEQSRLNINTADVESIARLLTGVTDLNEEKAEVIANSIADWRDSDNERPGLNVVNNEDLYYKLDDIPYAPKNAYYECIEELLLVKDMTPDIYMALEPYITVYGDGGVNINTSRRVVLSSLGLSDRLVDKILYLRATREVRGKKTRPPFMSTKSIVGELKVTVDLDEEEKNLIEGLIQKNILAVDSDYYRIVGIGTYRNEQASVYCILDRYGSIKYWRGDFGVL